MNRQQFEQQFESISDQIWDFAETRYQEFCSSTLQADFLKKNGFTIERNLGGIATAFSASFGSGHPVIGLLGEYDALPRMNQTPMPVNASQTAPAQQVTAADTTCSVPAPWRLPASSKTGWKKNSLAEP